MKEVSSKSKKREHTAHNKRDCYDSKGTKLKVHSKNVLKETHHRNSVEQHKEKRKKVDQSKHSKHEKGKRLESPHHIHRNYHSKVLPKQSFTAEKEDLPRSHKRKDVAESYEELSRRKRRIESELHALDLEEAAAKEAERKRPRRDETDYGKRRADDIHIKEEIRNVRIKEEPLSDDERPSIHSRRPDTSEQKNRHKHHPSKSSDEEKNWGRLQHPAESKKVEKDKEKPNFAVSGKLAEDTNTYNGVVIKYNEPSEARKPRRRWRLYPFKGDTNLPFIPIHRQSAYLFGRTRLIADIPIDHPSCSKQHAVLQFRLVSYKREDGSNGKRVRPYIIDLESSNGTFVNNKKVDPRCYIELMERDVVKFGFSSREYVLLHEESKNDCEDDDVLELSD